MATRVPPHDWLERKSCRPASSPHYVSVPPSGTAHVIRSAGTIVSVAQSSAGFTRKRPRGKNTTPRRLLCCVDGSLNSTIVKVVCRCGAEFGDVKIYLLRWMIVRSVISAVGKSGSRFATSLAICDKVFHNSDYLNAARLFLTFMGSCIRGPAELPTRSSPRVEAAAAPRERGEN